MEEKNYRFQSSISFRTTREHNPDTEISNLKCLYAIIVLWGLLVVHFFFKCDAIANGLHSLSNLCLYHNLVNWCVLFLSDSSINLIITD